ncbi:hypothetical protein LPJ61_002636 [Coemansia biformis]|uniref:Uncharacterized protein n=1 Tax=Coemansia biformis TaxID=1286918 RepID=A0A9W8CX11_9FUNG|nr:hypothetical protein LPJ61_002636 [Coemansia biformis]
MTVAGYVVRTLLAVVGSLDVVMGALALYFIQAAVPILRAPAGPGSRGRRHHIADAGATTRACAAGRSAMGGPAGQRRACPMWDDDTFHAHYTLALGFAGGSPDAAQAILDRLYACAVNEALALEASLAGQAVGGQQERGHLDRIYTRVRFPVPSDMAPANSDMASADGDTPF